MPASNFLTMSQHRLEIDLARVAEINPVEPAYIRSQNHLTMTQSIGIQAVAFLTFRIDLDACRMAEFPSS
ncbi:hypothetical protein RRG08_002714 [Elysia crispata]|uniref:Uncharacterized protein n=1 Tax=Elysia crispata TaxID=231223 RepID=A0AAE0XTX5_9GAST|nr:hypothetical protein RRG08_002714 [Elysia crispata]